jgi:hypothetical protein
MKRLLTILFLLGWLSAAGQTNSLTPGAALLFKNVKSTLTPAEKNLIVKQLGFLLSKDKKQFIADAESADYPFDAIVYPTDMNRDGKEEVFVSYGNTYTSGMAGQSIALFIKDPTGIYRSQLGVSGTVPDALPAATNKYPDLVVGGPGFEFPIWRWNGKEYVPHGTIKDAALGKAKTTNVEALSKAYTSGLK